MNFRPTFLALVTILICGVIQVQAQDQSCSLTLSGKVLDAESGEPIPFATIEIESKNLRIVSGKEGDFSFPNLCPGNYELNFRFLGYQQLSKRFNLPSSVKQEVRLQAEVKDLDQVVVEGGGDLVVVGVPGLGGG